jgi:hypothetical protein
MSVNARRSVCVCRPACLYFGTVKNNLTEAGAEWNSDLTSVIIIRFSSSLLKM